ncbi:VOC family protein [Flavisolibacter sp. BT320]|nr:VOC family protein [Flavisolibacter longurius]
MKKLLFASAFFLLAFLPPALAQKKPRINHIALSVAELERSRVFYQEVIGLDTIPEPFHDGRHVWFAVGDAAHLHLIQNPPPIEIPSKNTHLCFSVADIKAFVATLQKRKIAFEDWPGKSGAITTRTDGIHQVYLKDPDGYWVEINDDYK